MAAAESSGLIELDANYLVAALSSRSRQSGLLTQWMREGAVIQMSAVAWSEYLCGPDRPLDEPRKRAARRMIHGIEPFTEVDAELASELFNATGRRSRSHVDCMIAAHAIRRCSRLATLSLRDFARFEKFELRLAQAF